MNKKFLTSVMVKDEKSGRTHPQKVHMSGSLLKLTKECYMKKKAKKKAVKKKAVKRKVVKKKVVKKKVVKKKAKRSGTRKASGLTKITYAITPELTEIVGKGPHTRPQIVKKLWVYIKAKKCQDTKNRRMINPDDKLSKVIGKKPVDMLKLATHISKHIKK